MFAKSEVIDAAVLINSGKWSFFNTAMDVSAAFTVTLTAAMVRPDASRTGAAMERIPNDSCSSDSAHPRLRISTSD